METGIDAATIAPSVRDNRVYTIDGRQMGNDLNKLGRGIYIINGKKVIK